MSNTRWAFNITKWEPSEQEFLLASSCLQIEEKNRIDKFVYKKDVKASLAGRLMIRKFICQNSGLPYNSIQISRDHNNKPFYNKNNTMRQLSFNISHHGSFTVLAGEIGKKNVGIDIMKLEYNGGKPLENFFQIMYKNFSELEWQKIRNSSESNKIAVFCRNWALKESYLKAIGKGLTISLKNLSFQINSELQENTITSDTYLYINNQKQPWIFQESLIDPLHCVVVALENKSYNNQSSICNPIFKELSGAELLQNAIPILPQDKDYCERYFLKYS